MTNISIIGTTDIHGFTLEKNSGIFALPSIRRDYDAPILIDNGDYLIGSPESTYMNNECDISPLVSLANEIGYDVMIPGNHDFDYGIDFLKKQVTHFTGKYLCANLFDLDDQPIFDPYTIIERQGLKIGIIGVITKAMPQISRYELIKDLKFVDVIETLSYWVPIVKQQSDIVIVCYHGGIERNMETGTLTQYDTGEDQTYKIINEIKGIDGLICGHQHRLNSGICQNTVFVQPGYKGEHVGILEFELRDKKIVNKNSYILSTNKYLKNEKNDIIDFQLYNNWLQTPFLETDLIEYLSNRIENSQVELRLDGNKYIDLLQGFSQPYTLSMYHLSSDELKKLNVTVSNCKEDYKIVTNSSSLFPDYRLEKNFVYNIFDEFIRYDSREIK